MTEWIENPRQNPPPEGVMVEVRGSDCYGEWTSKAKRKDYKPGSTKGQLKRKWRWMDSHGEEFEDQAIDAWRHLGS